MASTRTPGITLGRDGRFFIDERYRGVRIGMRAGAVDQEQAGRRLRVEMERIDVDIASRRHARPRFADCVTRYLLQSQDLRSLEAIRVHVQLLEPYIGDLEPHQVHDATLAPFISARIAAGASATTINRSLEVVRTILHRAARSYRDQDGRPWLDALPPLITMLPECRRAPYPINWQEQDRLFPRAARPPGTHGPVRGEHGAARQQRMRPAMELGGVRARDRSKRVRDRRVQGQTSACGHSQ